VPPSAVETIVPWSATAKHTVALGQLMPSSVCVAPVACSDQIPPLSVESSTMPPWPAAIHVPDGTQLMPRSQAPEPWLEANHTDPLNFATRVPESPPATQLLAVAHSIRETLPVTGDAWMFHVAPSSVVSVISPW
jgi:hypothetical protein